ncbi:MAG: hypothetical protein KDE47_32455 [Caldilineaceae bacterium]|nr:hypothetical protein [Caldilineaceae bacterium]MCB0096542.1 hypothetical protein [Caldilineaceae bacterium]MCB9147632.1 hypothetical protein [Caldilineaceae bacterium]MCB9157315.1 hypothetical protein [Caldilineaceae bacterium]
MVTRKNLLVVVFTLMLAVSLSGCMMGQAMMPDREVEISMDAAMAGQNKAIQGALSGQATLTESEFSSLITMLLQQNAGSEVPIDSVQAMFDPGKIYIVANLAQSVGGIDKVGLVGNVVVQDHIVSVELDQAFAGNLVVSGGLASLIADRINAALNDPRLGTIVGVETGDGTVTLSMGM